MIRIGDFIEGLTEYSGQGVCRYREELEDMTKMLPGQAALLRLSFSVSFQVVQNREERERGRLAEYSLPPPSYPLNLPHV